MNKKEWHKYNDRIIRGLSDTIGKSPQDEGDIVNSLINKYLSNRSKEIHHTLVYDFDNPTRYAKLLTDLCNELATAEAEMLGMHYVLNNVSSNDDSLKLFSYIKNVDTVLKTYLNSNLASSDSFKKYRKGIQKYGND